MEHLTPLSGWILLWVYSLAMLALVVFGTRRERSAEEVTASREA